MGRYRPEVAGIFQNNRTNTPINNDKFMIIMNHFNSIDIIIIWNFTLQQIWPHHKLMGSSNSSL